MDERYWIMFEVDEEPSVDPLVEACLDRGLTTTRDGKTDICSEASLTTLSGEEVEYHDEPLQNVVENLSNAKFGDIRFWQEKHASLSVSISHDPPGLIISFPTLQLTPKEDSDVERRTREKVQRRVETIVELTGVFSEIIEPEYVYGYLLVGQNPQEGLKPTGRPISEHIDYLSWVTVLSEPVIEDFGGRERVLETPAWRVEELETGHIMIVRTNHPFDPTEGPTISMDDYLLEGKSRSELEAEASNITDPFARLADGEIGTDLVVRRENIDDGNLTNDDLEAVRCEVRDNTLYELESGEFLRRQIDINGDTIGELPADVQPEEEPYPPLIRLGVPTGFVRLDHPDDETIITKVVAMDIDVDKIDMLANLAATVDGDDDAEGLDSVDMLVNDLRDLEDVDGVEDLITDRIF